MNLALKIIITEINTQRERHLPVGPKLIDIDNLSFIDLVSCLDHIEVAQSFLHDGYNLEDGRTKEERDFTLRSAKGEAQRLLEIKENE